MNDKPDLSKVMEKIAKLLALAGNNPSESEAAAAAEKAQALLAEYNLDVSDVRTAGKLGDNVFIVDDDLRTDSLPWRRTLAAMVGKLYFCEYFYTFKKEHIRTRKVRANGMPGYKRYDIHSFVGEKHNLAVAKMMFSYLNDTIERLSIEGSLNYPLNERSRYRTSFKAACSNRLCWRINERIEAAKKGEVKTESGTNLPALASLYDQTKAKLDNFISIKVGKLDSKAVRHTQSHFGGMTEGHIAGDKIGLDQQVHGDKQARLGR